MTWVCIPPDHSQDPQWATTHWVHPDKIFAVTLYSSPQQTGNPHSPLRFGWRVTLNGSWATPWFPTQEAAFQFLSNIGITIPQRKPQEADRG